MIESEIITTIIVVESLFNRILIHKYKHKLLLLVIKNL